MIQLYRTLLLLVGGGGLLIAVLLLFVLEMSWSSGERLGSLASHMDFLDSLERVQEPLSDPLRRAEAVARLQALAHSPQPLSADTQGLLESLATRLANPARAAGDIAGQRLDAILASERGAHAGLLQGLRADNRRTFQALLALALLLPALGLALVLFLNRRVLGPVSDLSGFLALLARREYAVAATDSVDPLVRPLYERYNRTVKRMHDVDQGHQKREDNLRQQVDQATRALFQQQAAMARTERLAAVGEVSARLGHELRNPLSGVLMAISNLREEIDSEDQARRLGLAIAELERISHLLTRVVEESRQVPERPRPLPLRTVVDEVVSLAQHQVDDRVRLETAVPQDLVWTLPEAGFRHALLNLVLNAAQALQESGGTVRVEAGMEGGELAVIVSDDGPGFPDALLSAGVHEFGSWRSGGTGLGLATVRRFAFANSGRLQLGNRPQGGARATLLLPAAAAAR